MNELYEMLNLGERKAYEKVLRAITNREDTVSIFGIQSSEMMQRVLTALNGDHPELFYIDFQHMNFRISAISTSYQIRYTVRKSMINSLQQTLNAWIGKVKRELNIETNGLMNSYVDRLEGFEWYLKAAVNGHPTAQNNVAIEYINGEIVDQDYDIAVEWLEKATEQNDMYALNNYGTLLLKGEGVSRDADRAFNMFLSAAKQGYTDAKLNVGICYYQGWGTQRNLDEALRWLSEAYAEGAADAVDYLKKGFKNKNGYWVKKGFFGRVPAPETLPPAPQIERCTHGCNDCCDYIEHIENEDTKCHCSRLDMDVFIKHKCPFYKKTDAISDLARLARLLKAEKSEES